MSAFVKKKKAVEMTGAKELDKALSVFIPKIQNKILRKASRESGKIVAIDAKANAPEGDEADYDYWGKERSPGELKRSLKVRALPRSRTTLGVAIGSSEGMFTGDTFYGGFIEFGWKHANRYGHSGTKVDAKPFLRPALYDNANEVNHIFQTVAKQEIDKVTDECRRESGAKIPQGVR
jgi:HK97 gp10 family phage protein